MAAAEVIGGRLFVSTRDGAVHEIGFDAYPSLARIPVIERTEFEVEEDGIFLHWPHADVYLDVHDIRLALVPALQAEAAAQRLAHDVAFSDAVRTLRRQRGLAQTAIPELSRRRLRRIERGDVPGVAEIDVLARAHGMDPDAYLERVTEMMA